MSRTYIVFSQAKDDGSQWTEYGEIEATGAEAAIRKAYAEGLHADHYAACPQRNWTPLTPEVVVRPPVLKLTPVHDGQMSVDDVIGEADAALAASGVAATKS